MVAKVVGTVDNMEIVFSFNQTTGRWETAVPRDLDGTYVVDLWAYDEAGNAGYAATVLFTVDVERLHFNVELLKYRLHPAMDKLELRQAESGLKLVSRESGYLLNDITQRYDLERGHECGLQ